MVGHVASLPRVGDVAAVVPATLGVGGHSTRLDTLRATVPESEERYAAREHGHRKPPRVSDFQAVEQAAAMVDRFNKIFLRTLRAFRDLRRYSPAVVVQNAGQVNVGGQQVNIADGGVGGP